MKPKILYIYFLLIILFQSCGDVLDLNPLDKIPGDDVWNSEVLAKAYVTNLYSRIYFYGYEQNSMDYSLWLQGNTWFTWADEATSSMGNNTSVASGSVSKSNDGAGYWDYAFIRDCTMFLEKMETSQLSESATNQLSGEVRFMRAFAYFEMMKRYGGVPLVDVVLDPFKPVDDKYAKRATEEEIANFIDSELSVAESLLTDNPNPKGEINKWTALALHARAMLWAASIAKYGTVEINGLVGIPAAEANTFYTKASALADLVINSGKYELYNKTPDNKSENYRNIFMDKENSEIIFEKAYDGINIGHCWDALCAPTVFGGRGALCDPTLEFILGYENIDGSIDQPAFDTDNLYSNGAEPFVKKDPRLFATVFFQGDKWSIGTIQSYDGIDPSTLPDPASIISSPSLSYNGIPSVGYQSSVPQSPNNTRSGFTIKKFTDGSKYQIPEFQSTTPWIVFRLAEMYLIKAEAEFEIGNISPSVEALNMTRSRAGISLVDENTISLDKIRMERRSEMAFEGQRYWDLRRWRTAQSVLNSVRFHGLRIILHYESGKYYFIPYECETFSRVFNQQHYYNPITSSRIDNNPKLVENPLY